MSKQRSVKNGSKNDDWATPDYILEDIRKEFGNFFDPCPLKHNLNEWDGLEIDWKDRNFINPPYNNKGKVAFIKKAYEESLKGKLCILLIPAATELPIFHDLILPHAEVRFIRKRVRFKGFNSKGVYTEKGTGQMGSMFVIFDGRINKCKGCGKELSWCSNGVCVNHCGEYEDICESCSVHIAKRGDE